MLSPISKVEALLPSDWHSVPAYFGQPLKRPCRECPAHAFDATLENPIIARVRARCAPHIVAAFDAG